MHAHPGTPDLRTIDPPRVHVADVQVVPRPIHQDPRGFLVETLRSDDATVGERPFSMTYTSLTVAGEMRDRDRWHFHRHQQDRFVVVLGEMVLALYDARTGSRTHGRLDLLRMAGASPLRPQASEKGEMLTHLVSVPEGIYHAIGNLHPSDPVVVQNFPTRLYDAKDEGRVPFSEVPIPSDGGRPFSWDRVEVVR